MLTLGELYTIKVLKQKGKQKKSMFILIIKQYGNDA